MFRAVGAEQDRPTDANEPNGARFRWRLPGDLANPRLAVSDALVVRRFGCFASVDNSVILISVSFCISG